MKQLFFSMAMLIWMIGSAQNTLSTFIIRTDNEAQQLSWDFIELSTGDTLLHGENYSPNTWVAFTADIPSGTYMISIDDAGCDGWGDNGSFIIVDPNGEPLSLFNGSFWCNQAEVISFSILNPCEENGCIADLDDDGMVSVSDLLIFISEYGNSCE